MVLQLGFRLLATLWSIKESLTDSLSDSKVFSKSDWPVVSCSKILNQNNTQLKDGQNFMVPGDF